MPRPLRLDPPGGRQLVSSHGNGAVPVFASDDDVARFVDLTARWGPRLGVVVDLGAFRRQRVLLLVESRSGRLSDFMARVLGDHVRAIRQRRPGRGPRWKERFRSQLLVDDGRWDSLAAAILAAGEWEIWGEDGQPGQRGARWRARFGDAAGLRAAIARVQSGQAPSLATLEAEGLWTAPPPRAPGSQPAVPRRSVDDALADVVAVTGVPREQLFVYQRGRANTAAWLAAWWLTETTGLRQRQIASLMGVGQSGVSQRLRLLREADDPDLLALQATLRARRDT